MLLYNVLLFLGLMAIGPLWLLQRLVLGKPLDGVWERLGKLPQGPWDSVRPVWVHAVSVGEVLAAVPVVAALGAKRPVVVSTVTPTGRRVAQERLPQAKAVFYLPLDLPGVVHRAVQRIRPCLFLSVETEIWPNLLAALQRRNIPTGVINGRLSRRSFRGYRLLAPLLGGLFRNLRFMAVQTPLDRERALALGVPSERVVVTGNVKADSAPLEPSGDALSLRDRLGVSPEVPVWVAGSTHAGEEDTVARVHADLLRDFPGAHLVVAPRHPERVPEVERLFRARGLSVRRWSRCPGEGPVAVTLVDTLGELGRIYAAATVVFVGGSLVAVGGHNLLEPAGLGKPVLFGPHVENQHEIARLLLEEGGGQQVEDAPGLLKALRTFFSDPEQAARTGQRARGVVEAHRGAVARTLALLEAVLDDASSAS